MHHLVDISNQLGLNVRSNNFSTVQEWLDPDSPPGHSNSKVMCFPLLSKGKNGDVYLPLLICIFTFL